MLKRGVTKQVVVKRALKRVTSQELSSDLIEILHLKTGLEDEKILKRHAAFLDKFPTGEMSRGEFVGYTLERDPRTGRDNADTLFDIFDKDSSGSMDFEEFLMASLATKLQTLEDKLNWIFNVFDKDGGGSIDPSELREIVRGLFCLAGIKVPDEILDNRCQEMMAAIDVDGDREITKQEFIKNAKGCEFIAFLFQLGRQKKKKN